MKDDAEDRGKSVWDTCNCKVHHMMTMMDGSFCCFLAILDVIGKGLLGFDADYLLCTVDSNRGTMRGTLRSRLVELWYVRANTVMTPLDSYHKQFPPLQHSPPEALSFPETPLFWTSRCFCSVWKPRFGREKATLKSSGLEGGFAPQE